MAWYLSQSVGIESYDAPNNRTLYRTRVYLNATGSNSYSGYSTSGGGSVDGQGFSYTGPSAASLSNNGTEVYTGTFWVYGDTNGAKGTVSASSYFQGGGGYSPGYLTASASSGGFDFDRSPTTPSYTGITRSSDSTYFTITYTGGVNNSGPSPTYTLQHSTDNSNWTTYTLDANSRVYLTSTNQYYFRLYASNSDGTKYSSNYGPYYGIPSAPASITATRTKRSVQVTAGASTANGGTSVTGYSVQYSTNSGSSWSTAQPLSSLSYTYNNLTASQNYLFRVYATNATGNSLSTQTPSATYVPVGGKKWNGTSFVNPALAQRWTGTAWTNLQTAKRWDGTSWIDLA